MRTAPSIAFAALALAAAVPLGCASAPARPATPGSPAAYFPLAVGNEWTYADESPALPPERRGTHRTVKIVGRDADGFFRDSDGNGLRGGPDCVQDRMRRLLCAPLERGHGWSSVVSVSSTERYEIAAVGERVVTPAGAFAGCIRVRAHNRATPTTDHVLEISYAPGVGPVRIETYAVVDGKVVPQIKALLVSHRVGKVGP
jgi:hypothetical protein